MNQVYKYINHITWILNALKENNQILVKKINSLFNEKVFASNKSFQKFYYYFSLYIKLEKNIEKGYKILLTNNQVNKKSLLTLKNVYLYRSKVQLNEAIFNLKNIHLQVDISYLIEINSQIKNIASLINILESDIDFLILNLN